MNYKKFLLPAFIALFSLIALECDSNKLDIGEIINSQSNQNSGKIGDTVYIKQNPDWKGFNRPMDIIIGHEPFVYVADTYNDRIVMMNLNGDVLGTKTVPHPVALAQDFQDNLLVCASFDTTIQGTAQTVSAVYKINLFASGHNIASAPMNRLLPTVNDFRFPAEVKRREYTGVCVFYDNSFYVSRKGPENESRPDDPDNQILIFQKTITNGVKKDTLIGPVPLITPEGTGLLSAFKISSLTAFNRRNFDVIVTLIGATSFKTQWLQYVNNNSFTGYVSRLQPGNAKMLEVNRFLQPEDAAVDNSGNIYVADAAKDSIFKFNPYGMELQSFGGASIFNHPYAVAVYNKVVYVADTDNNRILRFVLSTDL